MKVALTIGNLSKVGAYAASLQRNAIEYVLNPDDLHGLDGLLLAGGADVNPALYGEHPAPETERPDDMRDHRESVLLRQALERDVPMLGICRGNQFFNVYFGGKLVQHLPNCDVHRRKDTDHAHDVRPSPGTLLASIAGEGMLSVNSRHHQGVAAPAPGLAIAGVCPSDNLVEALEIPGKRFALAVQWHPEDRPEVECDRRIFEAFARALKCPPLPKP